jgi:hypothetical protein
MSQWDMFLTRQGYCAEKMLQIYAPFVAYHPHIIKNVLTHIMLIYFPESHVLNTTFPNKSKQ